MKVDDVKIPYEYDRRRKLTDDQKEVIRKRYGEENTSLRILAKEYGVSKSMIEIIINPERAARVKAYAKEHRKEYQGTKEVRREYMRNHRKYKRELINKGIIKGGNANG